MRPVLQLCAVAALGASAARGLCIEPDSGPDMRPCWQVRQCSRNGETFRGCTLGCATVMAEGYHCPCSCPFNYRTPAPTPAPATNPPATPVPATRAPGTLSPGTDSPATEGAVPPQSIHSSQAPVASPESTGSRASVVVEGPAVVSAASIEQDAFEIFLVEQSGAGFSERLRSGQLRPSEYLLANASQQDEGIGRQLACCLDAVAHVAAVDASGATVALRIGPFPYGTATYRDEAVVFSVGPAAVGGGAADVLPLAVRVTGLQPMLLGRRAATAAAEATAAASALVGSGAAASSLGALALLQNNCLWAEDLSVLLHATGITLNGSQYLGCVVSNFCIVLCIPCMHFLLVLLLVFIADTFRVVVPIAGSQGRRVIDFTSACAAVRFPSHSIIACLLFYPGLVFCSWRVLFTASSPAHVLFGVSGCLVSLVFAVLVAFIIKRAAEKLTYKVDSAVTKPMLWLVGRGEWVNKEEDSLTRQRVGVLIHECTAEAPWFACLTVFLVVILGVVRAVPKADATLCGVGDAVSALTSLVVLGMAARAAPKHRSWDQVCHLLESCLQAAALLLSSFGYFTTAPPGHFLFQASAAVLHGLMVIILLKTVLGTACELIVVTSSRRGRLQREQDAGEFSVLMSDDNCSALEDTSAESPADKVRTQDAPRPSLVSPLLLPTNQDNDPSESSDRPSSEDDEACETTVSSMLPTLLNSWSRSTKSVLVNPLDACTSSQQGSRRLSFSAQRVNLSPPAALTLAPTRSRQSRSSNAVSDPAHLHAVHPPVTPVSPDSPASHLTSPRPVSPNRRRRTLLTSPPETTSFALGRSRLSNPGVGKVSPTPSSTMARRRLTAVMLPPPSPALAPDFGEILSSLSTSFAGR
ncbi:hypothetical protein DIPPA_27951 [Diplonema papillatum]|nr:hypothetical protein DIPPA_27951 [Diplonema papillatum]